jgi:hypothetical protein
MRGVRSLGRVLLSAAALAGLGLAYVIAQQRLYGKPVCWPQMWHLLEVGPDKPLGYLDCPTIWDSGYELPTLVRQLTARGLRTYFMPPSPEHFPHGALYVYDPEALQALLDEHRDILRDESWPEDAPTFVQWVSERFVDGHRHKALYRLIGVAFNDPRFV